ncbi:MAG: hypothetical protein PHR28_05785 [candidate division Zixibacteria bacterium]|nr:hypothetical protein [candidate division Zixibacteria bacterium]
MLLLLIVPWELHYGPLDLSANGPSTNVLKDKAERFVYGSVSPSAVGVLIGLKPSPDFPTGMETLLSEYMAAGFSATAAISQPDVAGAFGSLFDFNVSRLR